MTVTKNSDTITRLKLREKEIIILGTAHVSHESTEEVKEVIELERPDRVCIEIDESRYKSLTQATTWKNLNITRVLKEGKGFLLLSNLVLASFQKRLGLDLGIKPGQEMISAIQTARDLGIPFSLCDREIQITLKRAWAKTGLWGKNKMLAVMLSSILANEKLNEEEIEKLKEKSALQEMLDELTEFLPSVKEVLIDERDIYLATRIFESEGQKLVAVVGVGHVPGIVACLKKLDQGQSAVDKDRLNTIPPRGTVSRILPWIIPIAIIGAMIGGFFLRGTEVTIQNLLKWILINGTLAALGSIIALAHPLTILLAFAAAPVTSLIPVVGVGLFTGILEAALKKPRVSDFESLNENLTHLKGFYKNRVTHVLVVFMLSSLGSFIGTWLGGVPLFAALFG